MAFLNKECGYSCGECCEYFEQCLIFIINENVNKVKKISNNEKRKKINNENIKICNNCKSLIKDKEEVS